MSYGDKTGSLPPRLTPMVRGPGLPNAMGRAETASAQGKEPARNKTPQPQKRCGFLSWVSHQQPTPSPGCRKRQETREAGAAWKVCTSHQPQASDLNRNKWNISGRRAHKHPRKPSEDEQARRSCPHSQHRLPLAQS